MKVVTFLTLPLEPESENPTLQVRCCLPPGLMVMVTMSVERPASSS